MAPAYTYSVPGGYVYQKIDPAVLKWSNAPAFLRPPTPPNWKPPIPKPFAEEEDKEDDDKGEDPLAEEAGGETQPDGAEAADAGPTEDDALADKGT